MKKIYTPMVAILFLLLSITAISQNIINGKVQDAQSNPYEFATVLLLKQKDSTLIKGAVTDDQGKFEFENASVNNYFLKISFIGKTDIITPAFEYKEGVYTVPTQKFTDGAHELKTVTVAATKPIIEIKAEKMILNVEDNVSSAGSDGLEILRKAPGVVIDNNDNIMLKGKNGVQVYIDNKPARLGGKDLANLLKSYNANNIEAIEVINNPSAKYEAEGNAGIINIRLKRNKSLGTNGTVALNMRYGITPKGNVSLNLNTRGKKLNFYTNLSTGMGVSHEKLNFYREQGSLFFDQLSVNKDDSVFYPRFNYRFGVDYLLNDKNTIGAQVNGNLYDGVQNGLGRTKIGSLSNRNKIDSIMVSTNRTLEYRNNFNSNLNYAYKGTDGKTFNLDADYGMYHSTNNSYNPNQYMSPDESAMYSLSVFGSKTKTDILIRTLKGDYEQNLAKGKLGAGFKFSHVGTDNSFDFYEYPKGIATLDLERSSDFSYDEMVYAAYVNYNKEIKKVAIQLGMRLENTQSHGLLSSINPKDEDDVKRNYSNLFPSTAITYTVSKSHTFGLTYSRRIDRPRYQNLNPFEQRLDELAFRKGNPFLNPQYSQNFNLNHTFKGMLTSTLSFSRTNDFFGQIIDSTQGKRTFITEKNIARVDNYSIGLASPIPLAKWYSGYVSLNAFRQVYHADFGANKKLDIGSNGFNAYSEHTASLKNGIKLQVSGWFNTGGIFGGSFVSKSMGSLDLGIQKSILNKKADIKISATDVLKTAAWNAVSNFGGIYFVGNEYDESQTVRVNFTYRFGKTSVKGARQRKTGLEDEQRRAGN